MAVAKNKKLSFENALKNLEEIVSELENGEISLDELMDKYKEGVLLSNLCIEKLDNAETAIDKLDVYKRQVILLPVQEKIYIL